MMGQFWIKKMFVCMYLYVHTYNTCVAKKEVTDIFFGGGQKKKIYCQITSGGDTK